MGIETRPGGVSATFTITAESPAHLGQMIQAIGEAMARVGAGAEDAPSGSDPASPSAAAWYRANGEAFYQRLRDTARIALEAVVAEGPIVPFAKINVATGMSGSRLAGSLASVGAAVTALHAPVAPFEADHKRKVYRMDPAVLEALREVIPSPSRKD